MVKSAAFAAARALRPLYARADAALIVAPAEAGSCGDQAMIDATRAQLAAAGRRVRVLYPDVGAPPGVAPLRGPVDYVDLREPQGRGRRRAAMAARAGVVAVIGADVIDGVYNPDKARDRLETAALALKCGGRAVVLGCSISQTPDARVIDAMRTAADLPVLIRDAISAERFERLVGRPAPLVADVAFLLEPELRAPAAREAADWLRARRAAGDLTLIVNASGHTLAEAEGRGEAALVGALDAWLAADPARAVLVMPHDTRPKPTGDVEAAETIHSGLSAVHGDRARLMRPPFDAWDVKAMMAETDLILTGRMHMAIAALGVGAAPLCVVYQGKYEGLMAHFGLDGLLMSPIDVVTPGVLLERLAALAAQRDAKRARVAAKLPAVKALAQRNIERLLGAAS